MGRVVLRVRRALSSFSSPFGTLIRKHDHSPIRLLWVKRISLSKSEKISNRAHHESLFRSIYSFVQWHLWINVAIGTYGIILFSLPSAKAYRTLGWYDVPFSLSPLIPPLRSTRTTSEFLSLPYWVVFLVWLLQ
jgi:hypothetical protein